MAITVRNNQFHLTTKNTSYIMSVYMDKYLARIYWGKRIGADTDYTYILNMVTANRAASVHPCTDEEKRLFLCDVPLEFSTLSEGLYRSPSCHTVNDNGCSMSRFEYIGYDIYDGKRPLSGLPAVYTEDGDKAQTLVICMADKVSGMKAYLSYTVFEEYDAVMRSVLYKNEGENNISLLSAQSATVDLHMPDAEMLYTYGDWERECNVRRVPIDHNRIVIDSKKGASSAIHNPFAAVVEKNADEEKGSVYGFSLVYSGSFKIEAEQQSTGLTRINAGINDYDFEWELKPGEEFQTPEAVMVYSDEGLGKMSRTYHSLYRSRLCRGKYRDSVRPMVMNPWAAYALSCSADNMYAEAVKGAELGFEMFVLDDGWFGNNDTPGVRPLGDWFPNKKFPGGLKPLVDRITQTGMKFGLWFEPEIISPDSELYKKHPDWILQSADREPTQMYHQLHLDMSKREVQDYIVNAISKILDSADISYVKWDYNRAMIDTPNRRRQHESLLGTYSVLERLTSKYPDVLFEGCSSGGGRFDPGMLYYMPQTWTSDNQNSAARTRIQYGTSMVYPAVSMTAHAEKKTDVIGYNRELDTSAKVAMSGNFGYEMALVKLNDEEMAQTREYVKAYKEIRKTVQFGSQYRIGNPFKDDKIAVEYVDNDMAVLFTYQRECLMNGEEWRIKLKGLDKSALYEYKGKAYSGEALMNIGIRIAVREYELYSGYHIFRKVG